MRRMRLYEELCNSLAQQVVAQAYMDSVKAGMFYGKCELLLAPICSLEAGQYITITNWERTPTIIDRHSWTKHSIPLCSGKVYKVEFFYDQKTVADSLIFVAREGMMVYLSCYSEVKPDMPVKRLFAPEEPRQKPSVAGRFGHLAVLQILYTRTIL